LVAINSQLQASPSGIKINTNLFKKMKKCIENGEILDMDIMSTTFPCEITMQHLSCFQVHIELKNNIQNTEFEGIDIFLLALWEYSQYLNYTKGLDNGEKGCLTNKLKEKAKEIEMYFNYTKDKIPLTLIDRLTTLKNAVINNQITFMDMDLNNWISEIALYINNSIKLSDNS
ncbi:MAG: hypothetical protein ACI8WT_001387, partial [Clostridium sp.]